MTSHVFAITGSVIKYIKYNNVNIIPVSINGYSTGFIPIHVNINISMTNVQKLIWLIG